MPGGNRILSTKKLQEDNLMLMGRIQQLEKELEEKRKPIKDEAELRRLEKEMMVREMRHSKTLDATRAEVIREAMTEMEELNHEHKRQMESLEESYQVQTESLKQTVDLLEKEAVNLQERTDFELSKKNAELEELTSRITDLTSRLATSQSRITALVDELEEFREEERKAQEYTKQIDQIRKTVEQSHKQDKWRRLSSGSSAHYTPAKSGSQGRLPGRKQFHKK